MLRNGALVETLDAEAITADQLAVAVVGHEIRRAPGGAVAADFAGRKTLLDVAGLSWTTGLAEFSLAVREGEILGITGPEGAGKSELLRTVFGLLPATRGSVTYVGDAIATPRARRMLQRGVAFVPEDRFTEGLLLNPALRRISRCRGCASRSASSSSETRWAPRPPARLRRSRSGWPPSTARRATSARQPAEDRRLPLTGDGAPSIYQGVLGVIVLGVVLFQSRLRLPR